MDIRARRIPNALILMGLTLGLSAQAWTSGASGMLTGLAGAGIALVILIGPFALKALGAGDVKLGMVIGMWTDVPLVFSSLVYGALLTGIISACFWSLQAFRPTESAPRIPVAVPLGVATIITTAGLLPPLLALS